MITVDAETLVTWVAFFAAVAAILTAVLSSSRRLDNKIDGLGQRLDGVEQRLDAKIDGVEQRLDGKIEDLGQRLDGKIDRVGSKLSDRIDGLHKEVVEFRLETREEFGRVNMQLGRHEEKLALWERFIWARTAPELFGNEALAAGARAPENGPSA